MHFIGYVQGSKIDMLVDATNGTVIEYYFSLEELYYECGEEAEYSIIYLEDVEVILSDLSIMDFKDIGMN
jgi:hypothetical protein